MHILTTDQNKEPREVSMTRLSAYTVHVSGQLKQQGDGLPCSDSHVDVLAFQQSWQFRQVPAKPNRCVQNFVGVVCTTSK